MRSFRITPNTYSYNLMLRATRDCGVGEVDGNVPVDSELLISEGTESAPASAESIKLVGGSEYQEPTTHLPNLLMDQVRSTNVLALTNLDRSDNRY